MVECRRCRSRLDTREELQAHSEALHGDFMQSRTRAEYLQFRRDRGDDLTTAKQIPHDYFMSVYKLKGLMRVGKAESDLYSVNVGAKKTRRKRKANCLGCGKPLDTTKFGKKYHKECRPSKKPKSNAPVKGKRRRRCAGCSTLFFPPTKKQMKCEKCRD